MRLTLALALLAAPLSAEEGLTTELERLVLGLVATG